MPDWHAKICPVQTRLCPYTVMSGHSLFICVMDWRHVVGNGRSRGGWVL